MFIGYIGGEHHGHVPILAPLAFVHLCFYVVLAAVVGCASKFPRATAAVRRQQQSATIT